MLSRRVSLEVYYEGIDISKEINGDILSFLYTDNASGFADDISIMLKDPTEKWLNEWFPDKGDHIKAIIKTTNWRRDGDIQKLDCGNFIIDEPEYSGPPNMITINGNSMPSNSDFTDVVKSRSWKKVYSKVIASDLARLAGLELFFDTKENPYYRWIAQKKQTDLKFLSDLCKDEGLALKFTDGKIVMFDEAEYEKRLEVAIYKKSSSLIKTYSFRSSLAKTAYSGVKIKYRNEKNEIINYSFINVSSNKVKKIFSMTKVAKNLKEAERLTRVKFRELNKKEYSATLSVVGNLEILGGRCVVLSEFGKFSGKYYIDSANHSIGTEYVTNIEMHKVLEG